MHIHILICVEWFLFWCIQHCSVIRVITLIFLYFNPDLYFDRGFYNAALCYKHGSFGYPQDSTKAFELYLRSAELGKASAMKGVAYAYLNGDGVGRNLKKAKHYMELAAMSGDWSARHYLGDSEREKGNFERATKHYMISAGKSLLCIVLSQ